MYILNENECELTSAGSGYADAIDATKFAGVGGLGVSAAWGSAGASGYALAADAFLSGSTVLVGAAAGSVLVGIAAYGATTVLMQTQPGEAFSSFLAGPLGGYLGCVFPVLGLTRELGYICA